jgi:hypothetical protein
MIWISCFARFEVSFANQVHGQAAVPPWKVKGHAAADQVQGATVAKSFRVRPICTLDPPPFPSQKQVIGEIMCRVSGPEEKMVRRCAESHGGQ